MRSISSLLYVLLILSASMMLGACGTLGFSKSESPNVNSQLPESCPSLGDIANHIERREYRDLTKSLHGCITDSQIDSTYNGIFSDFYKYKFFVEAVAAYADYQDFCKVIGLRRQLPQVSIQAQQLLVNYKILAEDNYHVLKQVMQCVLILPQDAQPCSCIDSNVVAIQQSPVRDVYEKTFGNPSLQRKDQPGKYSREQLIMGLN